jgi:Zinc dependent phospholipase C
MTGHAARAARAILVLLIVSGVTRSASGYSVLTHEQIVDLLWKDQIQPLLLKRFPSATEEDLRKAHAYAYGGCVVQDMGYYPFGSKFFSDLVHYVRSGDFVVALVHESSDINEYAFALGALSHYASDNSGHPTINRVVAIAYPKLRARYGDQVTYADSPSAHIQTEFGFDMVQVAKNRYTSDSFHDFVGFEVSKPVLERAFADTYHLNLEDVVGHIDLAIGTFRRAVSKVIPEMTRVAVLSRHPEFVADTPNASEREFLYYLSRSQYEKEWGTTYRKPGVKTRILAFFLRLMPKFGPFKPLAFEIPTTQTEDMYIKSVDKTVENYASLLHEVRIEDLQLPNTDFDTDRKPRAGEYVLSDKTYARLLHTLSDHGFDQVTPELRENILAFYATPDPPGARKKDQKAWRRTLRELGELEAGPPRAVPALTSEEGGTDSTSPGMRH